MPATETTGVIDSGSLARTYSAGAANMKRGTAVMLDGDDVVISGTANAQCVGILVEDTINVGDPAIVETEAEAVFISGANGIVAPAYLISNGTGQLVPSTAIGDQVIARAVSSTTLAGDYGVCKLTPFIR